MTSSISMSPKYVPQFTINPPRSNPKNSDSVTPKAGRNESSPTWVLTTDAMRCAAHASELVSWVFAEPRKILNGNARPFAIRLLGFRFVLLVLLFGL